MTYTELSKNIADTIHQFTFVDTAQGEYQGLAVRISNEQYFINYMSQYALYNDTVYALCEAQKVQEEELNYIIVDARHPDNLKAMYRINESAAFQSSTQGETTLDEGGLEKASELAQTIAATLIQQSLNQLDSYAKKFKSSLQRELEQQEKVIDFLKAMAEKDNTTYQLTGDPSIDPLHGESISQLIDQYLEQYQQQFQPHELLTAAVPIITVEQTPEVAALFEKMNGSTKNYVENLCIVPVDLYFNLFKKQSHILASRQ